MNIWFKCPDCGERFEHLVDLREHQKVGCELWARAIEIAGKS